MGKNYYVPNGEGKRYATQSIVKARAYCVKMIEKYPKAQSWVIYTGDGKNYKNHHSFVTFYGNPAGYGWTESRSNKRTRFIYKNGKLVLGKMKYVGIGVR